MVADFHKHGVHVLFPMMMWDQGTRDPGKPWPQAIAELMADVGADGINGDTHAFVPEDGPSDALAWNVRSLRYPKKHPFFGAQFAEQVISLASNMGIVCRRSTCGR